MAPSYTGRGWMGALDGGTLLSALSIPGSHDSGALHEPLRGTSRCQNLAIAEQLAIGVRYLDIRCRNVDNLFKIYHGRVSQLLNFEERPDSLHELPVRERHRMHHHECQAGNRARAKHSLI